jgi:cellulose synthase/poly-beta-1,6-N-acetylglucosamine synthase-like glycosyltransferase
MQKVSVIVTLARNGVEGISALVIRTDAVFKQRKEEYEIIIIAKYLTEDELRTLGGYAKNFSVRYFVFESDNVLPSLIARGVALATYDTIALVDVERFPPLEILSDVLTAFTVSDADIVTVNRRYACEAFLRMIANKAVVYSYGEMLPWLMFDANSSIKVCKRNLFEEVRLDEVSSTIDVGFFARAQASGHTVVAYNAYPLSKQNEAARRFKEVLASATAKAKSRLSPDYYEDFDDAYTKMHGAGFRYKGKEYITHNTLSRKSSAVERTTLVQRFIITVALLVIGTGAMINWAAMLIIVVSLVTILYFCDLLFNMFLIYRSLRLYSEIVIGDDVAEEQRSWPMYTILCPLYKEALVVPQFIEAMKSINYPKRKLEVLLLLEENDMETIETIRAMKLQRSFKVTIVPHSIPKTKPKACNYGLLRAKGEYAVIYDAEDIPDPLQLKKAVIAFEQSDATIGCIQAKLNYYNWSQNLLTRLFTLEYSLWFNLILTGLQSIRAPIPLGGTSNHFRTCILRELGGWDPFNVTEDADLGIRLAKRGLKTAILDSTTYEEANSAVGNWLKQRSRWIKGYIQTYLVHMRDVREFSRHGRRIDMVTFQLVIGGKIISMLINPLLWVTTVGYFLYRASFGAFVETLYITPIFYIGATSLIIGNFLYLYYYMIGSLRQGRPELVVFAVFVPLYWLMMSVAAVYALHDLIMRPFHWHKTKHGLHLKKIKAGEGAT